MYVLSIFYVKFWKYLCCVYSGHPRWSSEIANAILFLPWLSKMCVILKKNNRTDTVSKAKNAQKSCNSAGKIEIKWKYYQDNKFMSTKFSWSSKCLFIGSYKGYYYVFLCYTKDWIPVFSNTFVFPSLQ